MDQPEPVFEVPSNCLSIPVRDGYVVEFEAEAARTEDKAGFLVWLTLFDEGQTKSSAGLTVPSLDQFTLKGLAIGYAEGWDRG
jgi:hypothetical protein